MIRAFWTFEQNTFPIHYAIGTQLDSNLELESSFALQKNHEILQYFQLDSNIIQLEKCLYQLCSYAHRKHQSKTIFLSDTFYYLTVLYCLEDCYSLGPTLIGATTTMWYTTRPYGRCGRKTVGSVECYM